MSWLTSGRHAVALVVGCSAGVFAAPQEGVSVRAWRNNEAGLEKMTARDDAVADFRAAVAAVQEAAASAGGSRGGGAEAAGETTTGSQTVRRNLAAALAARAERRRRAKQSQAALADLDEAIRLHPERLRYRELRGRARFEAGRDVDYHYARQDFEYVLARDPGYFDALVNLGQISWLERRLDETVRLWQRALALRPTHPYVKKRLAAAIRERDVEAAYEELRDGRFIVRHGPSLPRSVAETVLTICRTAYDELTTRFQVHPQTATVVTIYRPAEFRTATRVHRWVAGLSDGTIRLTLREGRSAASLESVLRHEYTHHLIRQRCKRAPGWLHEGLAQLADGSRAAAARARLARGPQIEAAELGQRIVGQSDARVVSRFYDVALVFTHFLVEQGGDRGILDVLTMLADGRSAEDALRQTYGEAQRELVARLNATLRR